MDKSNTTTKILIQILIKILMIIIIVLLFWQISKYYNLTNRNEGFQNNTSDTSDTNNINYLKLNETYLEADDTNLELLYSSSSYSYSGDQSASPSEEKNNTWTNKTLDQCVDTCNQLENCIGFSRDLVNDDSPANCYPRTKISNCHSNRKGDNIQMQNAIKYNSYVKTNTPNVLTKCIGDEKLTLNRSVYIKSLLYPTKYIGNIGDGSAILVDIKEPDFNKKCNFRIEIGKDGIGTVSFLHIDSNTYLCRNKPTIETFETTSAMIMPTMQSPMVTSVGMINSPPEKLIFKSSNISKTEDKQRVSFNILDAKKNLMRFRCLPLDGETIDKFIMINPDNNKYLSCMSIDSSIDDQLMIFNIVDHITKSKIIDDKNNLSSNTKKTNARKNTITTTTTTIPNVNVNINEIENNQTETRKLAVKPAKKEAFDEYNTMVLNDTLKLDTSSSQPLYKNLFTTPTNVIIDDYLNDNYNKSFSNQFISVNKKLNNTLLNDQLDQSVNRNANKYQEINNLNKEIEREIANMNMDLNGKNDKIVTKTNNMRITDMANDYFALKSVYNGDLSK